MLQASHFKSAGSAAEMAHCSFCGNEIKFSGVATTSARNESLSRFSRSLTRILRHDAPRLGLDIGSDGFVLVGDLLRGECSRTRQDFTLQDILHIVSSDEKRRFQLALYQPRLSDAAYLSGENPLRRDGEWKHLEDICSARGEISDRCASSAKGFKTEEGRKQWFILAAGSIPCSTCLREEVLVYVRATQGHSLPQIESSRLLTRVKSYEHLLPLVSEVFRSRIGEDVHPSGVLVLHGTYLRNWSHIKEEGLKRMSRRHIHLVPVPTWEWQSFCDLKQGRPPPRWGRISTVNARLNHSASTSEASCEVGENPDGETLSCSTLGSCGLLYTCSLGGKPYNRRLVFSGFRSTCDLLVVINFRKAVNSGIEFYFSANGVVCTEGDNCGHIPPNCLSFAVERRTGRLLHI